MPTKVLLDENMSPALRELLLARQPTWEVFHVYDVGLRGWLDADVFAWAQTNGYLIITFDTDFANGQDFPVSEYHGIIRLRLKFTTAEEALRSLEPIFERVNPTTLQGRIVIFKNERIRIRPCLPEQD